MKILSKSLLALAALPLLAACNIDKPYEPYAAAGDVYGYTKANKFLAQKEDGFSTFRVVAVSEINVPKDDFLGTVINDKTVTGEIDGRLIAYYFLDVKEGQEIVLTTDSKDILMRLEPFNGQNAGVYNLLSPEYNNVARVTGKVKVALIQKPDVKGVTKYSFKLTAK